VPSLDVVTGNGLRTVADGLDHPEGVCWSPEEEVIYAGGEAGQLYRVSLGGELETALTISGGFLLGMALDAHGNLFVCDMGNGCVQRVTPDGRVSRHGSSIGVPNYPSFDQQGRLFVSDSGSWDGGNGGVVRIDPDGLTERLDMPPLAFSNGTAIRDDKLYIIESQRPGVVAVPLEGGELEVVVTLDRCVPDGLAFDAEGGVWVSCWQPNRIYHVPAGGEPRVVVDDWTGEYVLSPTNVAFAGTDLDVLVLASLAGWGLRAITPGVKGCPIVRPVVEG
jgi:gluconolactonase